MSARLQPLAPALLSESESSSSSSSSSNDSPEVSASLAGAQRRVQAAAQPHAAALSPLPSLKQPRSSPAAASSNAVRKLPPAREVIVISSSSSEEESSSSSSSDEGDDDEEAESEQLQQSTQQELRSDSAPPALDSPPRLARRTPADAAEPPAADAPSPLRPRLTASTARASEADHKRKPAAANSRYSLLSSVPSIFAAPPTQLLKRDPLRETTSLSLNPSSSAAASSSATASSSAAAASSSSLALHLSLDVPLLLQRAQLAREGLDPSTLEPQRSAMDIQLAVESTEPPVSPAAPPRRAQLVKTIIPLRTPPRPLISAPAVSAAEVIAAASSSQPARSAAAPSSTALPPSAASSASSSPAVSSALARSCSTRPTLLLSRKPMAPSSHPIDIDLTLDEDDEDDSAEQTEARRSSGSDRSNNESESDESEDIDWIEPRVGPEFQADVPDHPLSPLEREMEALEFVGEELVVVDSYDPYAPAAPLREDSDDEQKLAHADGDDSPLLPGVFRVRDIKCKRPAAAAAAPATRGRGRGRGRGRRGRGRGRGGGGRARDSFDALASTVPAYNAASEASFEYLVSWEGFDSAEDTWEPYESIHTVLAGWTWAQRKQIPMFDEYRRQQRREQVEEKEQKQHRSSRRNNRRSNAAANARSPSRSPPHKRARRGRAKEPFHSPAHVPDLSADRADRFAHEDSDEWMMRPATADAPSAAVAPLLDLWPPPAAGSQLDHLRQAQAQAQPRPSIDVLHGVCFVSSSDALNSSAQSAGVPLRHDRLDHCMVCFLCAEHAALTRCNQEVWRHDKLDRCTKYVHQQCSPKRDLALFPEQWRCPEHDSRPVPLDELEDFDDSALDEGGASGEGANAPAVVAFAHPDLVRRPKRGRPPRPFAAAFGPANGESAHKGNPIDVLFAHSPLQLSPDD